MGAQRGKKIAVGGKARSQPTEMHEAIASVFEGYPKEARSRLYALRQLIFESAAELEGVGELTETLKWGEVSYLTEASKSGSTIRIGWRRAQPEHYALFLNCNTTLISDWTNLDMGLRFEGKRAIVMPIDAPLPKEPHRLCIQAALTYHQNKQ
ncbi:MAG: DUF1801 domain-containing protein [Kofleriaceae bacterium]|nr:DUF1801 domain-containing protein [Kofleriaceae bacterium]